MKLSYRFLAVFAGAVILASCASAPKPAPQTQTQTAAAPDAELQHAKDLKAQDEKYGLDKQVPAAYERGVAALTAGQEAMGTDNATAKTKLDEAIAAFQEVYDTGMPVLVADREQEMAKAKQQALDAKANNAVPDQFQQAQSLEQQATEKKNAKAYTEAYDLLPKARAAYLAAADAAKKKRLVAEQALKNADAQIEQTKSTVGEMQKNLDAEKSQSGGGQ